MKRAVVMVAAAVMLVAAVPASAAELRSFDLPSRLVDPTAPGGALEDDRTAPKVNVMLPDGYRSHPTRRYPVLWLLHGANGGTDTWIPGITELAAGLPGDDRDARRRQVRDVRRLVERRRCAPTRLGRRTT